MKRENVTWLKHLEEAVPVEGYGNRLSMYLIALEAWRRGITVNFFTEPNRENKLLIRFSLCLGDKEHKFVSSRGDLLTKEAYEICDNKDLTKQYLKKAGVKIPEGKRFSNAIEDRNEMVEYAAVLGFPVVVKPINENAGKGVFSNIRSKNELIDIVDYLCYSLNYTDLIVEEYLPGTEYRVLTIGDRIIAAVNRIPANVVGDGKKTIDELIKEKNEMKRDNPNLSKKTIQIDKEVMQSLEKEGYELNSVLPKEKKIFLRTKSNISSGGDPIDVTERLTEEQKTAVNKAIQAIPGLSMSGMDLIINPEDQSPTIIEVNTKPMLGLHVFPMEGKSRDVIKDIVDYYFPETKNGLRTNLYFDFEKVTAPLDNITVKEIEVIPPSSLEKIHAKKFTLYGEGFDQDFRNQIRLWALENKLHGYVRKVNNNETELLLGSEEPLLVEDFMSNFHKRLSENAVVQAINESEWDKPIASGFVRRQETRSELKSSLKQTSLVNQQLENEFSSLKSTNRILKREYIELQYDNEKVKQNNKDYKQTIVNLNSEIEDKKHRYTKVKKQKRKLLKRIGDLEKDVRVLEQEVTNLKNSKSWKVTKPLRQVIKAIKKK